MNSLADGIRARLDPYIQTLGIRWPLTVAINQTGSGVCALLTFPLQRQHTFCIHPRAVADYQQHLVLLIRGLCRARLGELLDPVFTCLVWDPERTSKTFNADELLLTHIVTHILGVWACDLRHEHWPELSAEEMAYYSRHTSRKDRAEVNQALQTNAGFLLEISEIITLAHRHVYDARALGPMMVMINAEQKTLLEYVSDFFVSLPKLERDNLPVAILQLEKAAQELTHLLSFDFTSKITRRQYYFWTVDSAPTKR